MAASPKQPPAGESRGVPKSKEELTEELRYLQQIYQNQYMALATEINTRLEALKNFQSTQQTLENIDTIQNKPLLLGIGGGAYANGTITSNKSVIISIGGGIMVEKDIDGAKGFVAKAIDNSTKSIGQLSKNRRELEAALLEISYKMEELSH